MRITNVLEKLLPSAINLVVVLLLASPFLIIWGAGLKWKVVTIGIFAVYNLAFAVFNKNRCLGMMLLHTYWQKDFSLLQKLIYVILYTASFATFFYWVYFPFDLLLVNLLLVQLPFVLIKQTTLHGYLAGNNRTTRRA